MGGRWEFDERMEGRRQGEEDDAQWKSVRRGWCLGGAAFRKERLERMEGELGEHHAGGLRRKSAGAKLNPGPGVLGSEVLAMPKLWFAPSTPPWLCNRSMLGAFRTGFPWHDRSPHP